MVDNLPVATRIVNPTNPTEVTYEHGYRLGLLEGDNVYINNHLKFILSYHKHTKYDYMILNILFYLIDLNTTIFDILYLVINIAWLVLKWRQPLLATRILKSTIISIVIFRIMLVHNW